MDFAQTKLCQRWTGKDNLSCLPENLFLGEKLRETKETESNYIVESFLKSCQVCGQVFLEKVYKFATGSETKLYYKIPGNLVNECHRIGHLSPVEILKDEKWCEGDEMYFGMEKETKMQCGKCGKVYIERICQSNYDGFYYQKYSRD